MPSPLSRKLGCKPKAGVGANAASEARKGEGFRERGEPGPPWLGTCFTYFFGSAFGSPFYLFLDPFRRPFWAVVLHFGCLSPLIFRRPRRACFWIPFFWICMCILAIFRDTFKLGFVILHLNPHNHDFGRPYHTLEGFPHPKAWYFKVGSRSLFRSRSCTELVSFLSCFGIHFCSILCSLRDLRALIFFTVGGSNL